MPEDQSRSTVVGFHGVDLDDARMADPVQSEHFRLAARSMLARSAFAELRSTR